MPVGMVGIEQHGDGRAVEETAPKRFANRLPTCSHPVGCLEQVAHPADGSIAPFVTRLFDHPSLDRLADAGQAQFPAQIEFEAEEQQREADRQRQGESIGRAIVTFQALVRGSKTMNLRVAR